MSHCVSITLICCAFSFSIAVFIDIGMYTGHISWADNTESTVIDPASGSSALTSKSKNHRRLRRFAHRRKASREFQDKDVTARRIPDRAALNRSPRSLFRSGAITQRISSSHEITVIIRRTSLARSLSVSTPTTFANMFIAPKYFFRLDLLIHLSALRFNDRADILYSGECPFRTVCQRCFTEISLVTCAFHQPITPLSINAYYTGGFRYTSDCFVSQSIFLFVCLLYRTVSCGVNAQPVLEWFLHACLTSEELAVYVHMFEEPHRPVPQFRRCRNSALSPAGMVGWLAFQLPDSPAAFRYLRALHSFSALHQPAVSACQSIVRSLQQYSIIFSQFTILHHSFTSCHPPINNTCIEFLLFIRRKGFCAGISPS